MTTARSGVDNGDKLLVTICSGGESSDAKASAMAVEGMTGSLKSGMPLTEPAVGRLSRGTSGISAEEKTKALTSSSSLPSTEEQKTGPAAGEKEEEEKEEETEGEKEELVFKALNQIEHEKRKARKRSSKKIMFAVATEWVGFLCILAWLIAGLTADRVLRRHTAIWGLETWKWSVLALAVFGGRLVADLWLSILVFPIKKDFLPGQNKFLYFINRLKTKLLVFLWLGLILTAWGVLIEDSGVERERSRKTRSIVNHVTRGLGCCFVGAFLWLGKALLVEMLAASSHVTRFYDRIRKSVFDQYVLGKLLDGPKTPEELMSKCSGFSIQVESMVDAIEGSRLTTKMTIEAGKVKEAAEKIFKEVAKIDNDRTKSKPSTEMTIEDGEVKDIAEDKEVAKTDNDPTLTTEMTIEDGKVKDVAKDKKVAKTDNEPKYIREAQLLQFMVEQDVDKAIPLFDGATESKTIRDSSFKKWLVEAHKDRKSLKNSLHDTKTAIDELNDILTGITVIAIAIVSVLLMGLVTTKVILLISSQFVLVAFMFGNTCKTLFESIVFVFVMHPFDLDDRCCIDGVQMVVDEMKLLTTIFLKFDREKVIYPNSVLATKAISNFYRSPPMGDLVELTLDFSTSKDTIEELKERIKAYLESLPHRWSKEHSVVVKDIINVNQMKIAVYVTHTINFQNYGKKNSRRSDLLLHLKKIFEDLNIKYHLLPQEVHLTKVINH